MKSPLLRTVIGEVLRARRLAAGLTLRETSLVARVSLGYLSEVERGHKEPSSELLAAISGALGMSLGELMSEVARRLLLSENSVQFAA